MHIKKAKNKNKYMIKKITKYPVVFLALIASLIAIFYWGLLIKERYVSTAHVIVQSPDIAPPTLSLTSMMSNTAPTDHSDLLYLREYLVSTDALKALNQDLDIREHFSSNDIDLFNRLDKKAPLEFFHEYYLKRVKIELDSYSNVLEVSASAYTADKANKIVQTLLELGEKHMNSMGQRLAEEQLSFIENQVLELAKKLEIAQQNVLQYQNEKGLISPTQSTESLFSITAQLNAELIKLKAEKNALSSVLSGRSPEIKKLNSQIQALNEQIELEKSKMTGDANNALNKVSADYNALLLKAQFASEIYANALATLEATRVEAARKLKQVSILQSPSMPDYPVDPNRIYMISLSIIFIVLIAIILSLMLVVIKDHKD